MRLLLSTCLIIGFTSTSVSQNNSKPSKNLFYGFNMGLNYTNIQVQNNPFDIYVRNNAGFNMGAIAGYQLTEQFSVLTNAALSFHDNELYAFENGSYFSRHQILTTTIDFGLQAKVNIAKGQKKSPYIILGPAIQIPLSPPVLSTEFTSGTNLAIELGVGCDIQFSEFTIAPEVRYSYGLNNVNGHPEILETKFHSIKLLLHFKS